MANPLKPWGQRAYDEALGAHTNQMLDWMVSALNQLIGQQNKPPSSGFNSLLNPTLDPASTQIGSRGGRTNSLINSITWTSTTTSITFYWDGTNGSKPLFIFRDDNTVAGPFTGSLLVSGLSPSTTYFFFPFFQDFTELPAGNVQNITSEPLGSVVFASVPAGSPIGSPPVAYLTQHPLVLQRQYLQDHIPLALNLGNVGITTPGAGTGSGTASAGGGGGSGAGRYTITEI